MKSGVNHRVQEEANELDSEIGKYAFVHVEACYGITEPVASNGCIPVINLTSSSVKIPRYFTGHSWTPNASWNFINFGFTVGVFERTLTICDY